MERIESTNTGRNSIMQIHVRTLIETTTIMITIVIMTMKTMTNSYDGHGDSNSNLLT